jgi:hypothetical protein
MAFVFAIAVFKTQNRSLEKTLNFVTFSEFLTHPRVHHTINVNINDNITLMATLMTT